MSDLRPPTSMSSSGLLPLPGSPASSWAVYRARFAAIFRNADSSVLAAFWLFGLINNVLYVIILSAAQDLVGNIPKGVVLLADIVPSFLTKLVAPYFIHRVPYATRVVALSALSTAGMLLIALTPLSASGATVPLRLVGVAMASASAGGGELSFLGMTHFYGPMGLAAWGSGTGGAGLVGAGLYVLLTDWMGLGVRPTLLASAFLPVVMLLSFFLVLPRGPLSAGPQKEYVPVPTLDGEGYEQPSHGVGWRGDGDGDDHGDYDDGERLSAGDAASALLAPGPPVNSSIAYSTGGVGAPARHHHHHNHLHHPPAADKDSILAHMRRTRALFFPYMLPLLLVYIAEYTINQGVTPTLLFPLDASPFDEYRAFYPFYGFLYQLGVFVSRSSTPFVRVRNLYLPSLLQVANLALLTAQSLLGEDVLLPSVYLVFAAVFWEGLLGGAVYVNTFAEIMDRVPAAEREFSLGATSVSDSGGVCVAGVLAMALEPWLCARQVARGRDWCRRAGAGG